MKKRGTLICTLMLIIIFLAGCSKKDVTNYNYLFQGENKHWKAVYKTDGTVICIEKKGTLDVKSNAKNRLTVTYKGKLKDLNTVKHFELSYKINSGGGRLVGNYPEGKGIRSKTFTFDSESILLNKDQIFKVTVILDGKKETIKLINIK